MKLLTHNMLTSHVKGVTKGYPLLIKVNSTHLVSTDANANTAQSNTTSYGVKAAFLSATEVKAHFNLYSFTFIFNCDSTPTLIQP